MKFVPRLRRGWLAVAALLSTAGALPPLLPPLNLGAQPLTLRLRPQAAPAGPQAVLVILRGGERASDVARAYGVPLSVLSVDPAQPQPEGAVLRLPLRPGVSARRLPPGVLVHQVLPGETLGRVASMAGLRTIDLVSANLDRQSLDGLGVGEKLLVPQGQRGLIVQIKPGQDVVSLSHSYGLDITEVARANRLASPSDVGPGDYLLLPGLQADGHMQELLARRERAEENERQRRLLEQYQRFVAFQKLQERRRLQARYAAQARYEKYLAWKDSARRQALQARFDRQAKYEAWLAGREKLAAAAQKASHAHPGLLAGKGGTLRTPTGVMRRAAYTGRPLVWPVHHFRLTSRFGEQDIEFHRDVFHGGIDLAAPSGTPIYAAVDGEVAQSGYGDYGLNVWTTSGNATIIYGHMSRAAVHPGQQVRRGDLLGFVGCTGFCTGPHLHFEIRINGTPVDPIGLLQ